MSTSGMFSTSGDIMMHVGDTMSTSGGVQYIGVFKAFVTLWGCHKYVGGIP